MQIRVIWCVRNRRWCYWMWFNLNINRRRKHRQKFIFSMRKSIENQWIFHFKNGWNGRRSLWNNFVGKSSLIFAINWNYFAYVPFLECCSVKIQSGKSFFREIDAIKHIDSSHASDVWCAPSCAPSSERIKLLAGWQEPLEFAISAQKENACISTVNICVKNELKPLIAVNGGCRHIFRVVDFRRENTKSNKWKLRI